MSLKDAGACRLVDKDVCGAHAHQELARDNCQYWEPPGEGEPLGRFED